MRMKYCKKAIAFVAVFALLLTALCTLTGCSSEENSGRTEVPIPATKPTLIVEGTTAKAGDKGVEILVKTANNPGILGIDFDLYYDDTVLTLTDAQSVLELDGCIFTAPAYYKNPTSLLWDFQDANWTEDGAFLKLRFDVSDAASAGEYEIKIMYSYGDIFDADLEPIDFGVKNGTITIS